MMGPDVQKHVQVRVAKALAEYDRRCRLEIAALRAQLDQPKAKIREEREAGF